MRFPLNVSRLVVPLLALLLTLLAAPVAAQTPCDGHAGRLADINTREQLKQFVHCAAAHVAAVGWQQAAVDFETSAWLDGSLSLFATRADGTVLFSPGSDLNADDNLWDWQDPDGVFPSREQLRITQDFGSGYVYLRYTNPATGQVEPLETYVQLMEYQGEAAYIGAALYPQDTHATCSPDTSARLAGLYRARRRNASWAAPPITCSSMACRRCTTSSMTSAGSPAPPTSSSTIWRPVSR